MKLDLKNFNIWNDINNSVPSFNTDYMMEDQLIVCANNIIQTADFVTNEFTDDNGYKIPNVTHWMLISKPNI